jgi:hypothetical protein
MDRIKQSKRASVALKQEPQDYAIIEDKLAALKNKFSK